MTEVACNNDIPADLSVAGMLHILRCPNKILHGNESNYCLSAAQSIAAIKCDGKIYL